MHIYFRNIVFSIVLSIAMIPLLCNSIQAQDTAQTKFSKGLESAKIDWIGQWPPPEIKNQKGSLKQRISDILLGKRKKELSRPVSMIVLNQNNYWILDQQNKAVFQVSDETGKVPHYIEKKNYNLSSLVGICKFRNSQILFTDSYLNKIFLIKTDKKECQILNDSLKLNKPTGIAYSELTHEIWVLETGAHRILVLNEDGRFLRAIGSRGTEKGEFNFPTHIWIDKDGNVYVVDAMNFRVQVYDRKGDIVSVFGSSGDATGYFGCPKGIATDSYGNIYVADALFHVVQIFDINGKYLYTFGSQGQGPGQFWMPSGIYIDENNLIYVSDSYNSRIQVFQLIAGGTK